MFVFPIIIVLYFYLLGTSRSAYLAIILLILFFQSYQFSTILNNSAFPHIGTLQMCGIFINAVTYVTIVIAIGLLVDFLMHILLRYYETAGATREEKVIETLETMGASMLMGGFTTWLGVIPLSLSSTKIFNTIVSSHKNRLTQKSKHDRKVLTQNCSALLYPVYRFYGNGDLGTVGISDFDARDS